MEKVYNLIFLPAWSVLPGAYRVFLVHAALYVAPWLFVLGQKEYPYDCSLSAYKLWYLPMQAIMLPDICSHLEAQHPNNFFTGMWTKFNPVEEGKKLC